MYVLYHVCMYCIACVYVLLWGCAPGIGEYIYFVRRRTHINVCVCATSQIERRKEHEKRVLRRRRHAQQHQHQHQKNHSSSSTSSTISSSLVQRARSESLPASSRSPTAYLRACVSYVLEIGTHARCSDAGKQQVSYCLSKSVRFVCP